MNSAMSAFSNRACLGQTSFQTNPLFLPVSMSTSPGSCFSPEWLLGPSIMGFGTGVDPILLGPALPLG